MADYECRGTKYSKTFYVGVCKNLQQRPLRITTTNKLPIPPIETSQVCHADGALIMPATFTLLP